VKYAASVPNETANFSFASQAESILRKKNLTKLEMATKASVKKEMARPRMAKSTRTLALILRGARNSKRLRARDLD
jgi:hypothetical protein